MAGRRDEVQHGVYTVVSEPRVTLDSRLLRQDIIVLPLEVADNLSKATRTNLAMFNKPRGRRCYLPRFVVNEVTETGCVDNGQRDASAFLIKLQLCRHACVRNMSDGAKFHLGDRIDSITHRQ